MVFLLYFIFKPGIIGIFLFFIWPVIFDLGLHFNTFIRVSQREFWKLTHNFERIIVRHKLLNLANACSFSFNPVIYFLGLSNNANTAAWVYNSIVKCTWLVIEIQPTEKNPYMYVIVYKFIFNNYFTDMLPLSDMTNGELQIDINVRWFRI